MSDSSHEAELPRLPSLDPVIHAQHRLRVMVALAAIGREDQITFSRLRDVVEMSAGNLSTHLRRLEDAGYVSSTKTYRRRTPVTYLALSEKGRDALAKYTDTLHELLEPATRHTEQEETRRDRSRPSVARGTRSVENRPGIPTRLPRPLGAG